MSCQVRSGQTRSYQVMSCHVISGQFLSRKVTSSLFKSNRITTVAATSLWDAVKNSCQPVSLHGKQKAEILYKLRIRFFKATSEMGSV